MKVARVFILTLAVTDSVTGFVVPSKSSKTTPKGIESVVESALEPPVNKPSPVSFGDGAPRCPFQTATKSLSTIANNAQQGTIACILALAAVTLNHSNADHLVPDAAWVAPLAMMSALGLAFENFKACDGPSFFELPKLILDLYKDGFLKLAEKLGDQYGSVYSLGPLTIVSGNAKNVDTVFKNSKLPTTLLGLPRDAGLASHNPHTVLEGRKPLMNVGTRKEESNKIIRAIAPKTRKIVDEAISKHKNDDIFSVRENILSPIASQANTEFIFSASSAKNSENIELLSQKLQRQGIEITESFGAKGILRTILRPWRAKQALDSTRNFLENLDQTVSTAELPPSCPMSQIQSSLAAGRIAKTDALQFASAYIYTGTESIEIVSESVLWMLAHPDNSRLQKEIRAELDRVLGGPKNIVSRGEHLRDCHLLRATIAEALRCYEFAMPMMMTRDVTLNDKPIQKGAFVLVTGFNNKETSATTGRAEWVNSPSEFNPWVWLDDDGHFDEKLLQKFSFFGQGQHKCPGRQLGLDTVASSLAATLSHFEDISYASGQDTSGTRVESVSQFRDKIQLSAKLR